MKALMAAVSAAAFLAACGTMGYGNGAASTTRGAGSTPTRAADGTLIGPDGRTLYEFARDVAGSGKSACVDGCATNWPPLAVAPNAAALGDYTILLRSDNTRQWAYKGQPLYYFAKDTRPGEKLGDGVNGVWNVAKP